MRILFANASESRLRFRASGGMERCFWHLLQELSQRHCVDAICRDLCDSPERIFVRALGPVRENAVDTNSLDRTAEYCRRVAKVALEYDVVVAFNFPELLSYTSQSVACIFFNDGWHWNSDLVLRPEQAFVFPAEWIKREFVSKTSARERSCFVLPMGVDLDQFFPRCNRSANDRALSLLFASTWHSGKGIERFLGMCSLLSMEGVPFQATLVGSTLLWDFGDEHEYIHPRDKRAEIEELVENTASSVPELSVLGEIPHFKMPTVYRDADLLVAPSYWRECLPLVVIESMACGTPAMASNSGGYLELIRGGQTGYLLTPPTIEHLATQVVTIVSGGGVTANMRDAARQAVLGLSWSEASRRLENILFDISYSL